jgi:hypothetical protein
MCSPEMQCAFQRPDSQVQERFEPTDLFLTIQGEIARISGFGNPTKPKKGVDMVHCKVSFSVLTL